MSRPAPLFRSTSWADVEDEEQAKLQEQRPEAGSQAPSPSPSVGNTETPQGHARQSGARHQGRPTQSGVTRSHNGRSGGKLWEPSGAKPLPKDGQGEVWRRGETLAPPSGNGRKPAAVPSDKPKSQKKRSGAGRGKATEEKQQPTFEICLRPIPESLTKEEAQKAFGTDPIFKMKLVKDKAFVHFATREAQERALKAVLPRWGDMQARALIPQPKDTKKEERPAKAPQRKPVDGEAKELSKKASPVVASATASNSVQPKKGKAEEKKITNIFAALDSDDEEDSDAFDDKNEEADEDEAAEETGSNSDEGSGDE